MMIQDLNQAVEAIFKKFGDEIRLATPLGLGKPNQLLNLIYEHAKNNPSIRLKIYTALSLTTPDPKEDLAKRFLGPFRDRHWGKDYPELKYELEAQSRTPSVPKNIEVHEFYFQAGASLHSLHLQKNYQSINYTAVSKSIFDADIQVLVQLIAKRGDRFSLSCNPDVTLDVVDRYRNGGKHLFVVGVVHPDLPFFDGEAAVDASFFDIIVEDEKVKHELFALPRIPVSAADHAIGFYTSQLIVDDGTLQIGIGSLSDAVVNALLLRHQKNELYLKWIEKMSRHHPSSIAPHSEVFEKGLYGLSEMIMDGFMHLRKAGILKREVKDEDSGIATYLHGAFFLGSKEFYAWLRNLSGEDSSGLRMSRISKINDLYDPKELLLRRQRKNARFLNTCMQVTLLGGAASETLNDGQVVSGVGGQYNFVSMSMELEGARSVLMLRSTRLDKGKRVSNIVWSQGHLTIPRHLRDVVVTEYGVADLRNKTDAEVIQAILNVTDSEFQEELLGLAKKHGKMDPDYTIPAYAKNNHPDRIDSYFAGGARAEYFKPFPLGSDFTPEEEKLALALDGIQKISTRPFRLMNLFFQSFRLDAKVYQKELSRMRLDSPDTLSEKVSKRILIAALHLTRQ